MGTLQTTETIRLLLIEDDDQDAFLIRRALSESSVSHYKVERDACIDDALKTLQKSTFDVAILDLTLPDSSGVSTVESVAGQCTALPIVVVTDHRDHAIGLQAVRSGAQGFISKSEVNGMSLSREIGHAIERQQMLQELKSHRDNLETLVAERTKELRDAVSRLEEHGRAKTDFIYNVSHELRTPLTSMIYSVENILDGATGPVTDSIREYLNMLNDDCRRMKRTVEDILDLSNIDANRFMMQRAPVQIVRFVQRVVAAIRGSAEKIGVSIDSQCSIDPVFVMGDADKLERSLFNLIQNAMKYSSRGDVINVSLVIDPSDDGRVTCRVIDSGPGIPAEHLEHVTERYYRVGDHIDGTGLGLPIAKALVEHHGGQLSMASPPAGQSQGTQATISLPIAPAPRVLVVDDEELIRRLCVLNLTDAGYQTEVCENGLLARSCIQDLSPDLLVLDLNLPDLGGVALISELKADAELRKIPILAITGAQTDKLTDEVLKGFAIPLLLKPWKPEQIHQLAESLLLGAHAD